MYYFQGFSALSLTLKVLGLSLNLLKTLKSQDDSHWRYYPVQPSALCIALGILSILRTLHFCIHARARCAHWNEREEDAVHILCKFHQNKNFTIALGQVLIIPLRTIHCNIEFEHVLIIVLFFRSSSSSSLAPQNYSVLVVIEFRVTDSCVIWRWTFSIC